MSAPSRAESLEAGMLRAEIEALQRRLDAAAREAEDARGRLEREAALASVAAARADQGNEDFAELAARARALEARVEEARAEAAACEAIADEAERDASRAAAEVQGLLARVATVADALGDDGLRRFARRALTARDAP